MLQSHMSTDQKDLAHSRQIKALRLLFLLLPPENYQLLHDLLMLLHRVAAHQKENLMSAINLGTMFAPHILCPRKMAPNDLQYLSGTLSTAVAFMIEQASQLFQIPLELEYDVRQYWSNKKNMRHQLSKRSMMEAPAKTIFTFIDRELTAQANDKDVTEIALAELYAYVQSLPDSAKKRRLIKQFNHASGSGTPQLNQSFIKKQEARGKRLGDSIKKHLFHKNVKSSKSKSQPFTSTGCTKVKRTNSEDVLSSPSTRSPELRMFRRNHEFGTPSRLKAKSLDDLSSHRSHPPTDSSCSTNSMLSSFVQTALHAKSHFSQRAKQPLPFSTLSLTTREYLGSSSSDQSSCIDPMSPLPLLSFSPDTSCNTREAVRESICSHSVFSNKVEGFSQSAFNFAPTTLEDVTENTLPWDSMLAFTPAGPQLKVHSPISQAMIRASIPQKVIMTPRSRCPIIINSATSLSNVAIPEENSHSHVFHNAERNESNASIVSMHTSPVIANPAAQLASPPRPVQPLADSTNISTILSDQRKNDSDDDVESENSKEKNPRTSYNCKKMESKLSRWGSSSLRRTLSSASSTGSLFGSFFRHLSTSSLAQLATRLTSSSSLQNSELEDENTNIENEFVAEEEEDDDDDMNESLSSVFKDYLLSRSILTENPVDLSSDCLDNEDIEAGEKKSTSPSGKMAGKKDKIDQNFGDSAYYSSQPPSKCTSRQCSKTSLGSFDSAVDLYSSTNLSESLLYCLDGKNPLCASRSGEGRECENCQTRIHTQDAVVQSQSSFWQEQHIPKHKHELELHSCSPDSRRQSLLKTKHGTPVPQREKELSDSTKNAREVLFETSF
nr:uncharacterized protein LOC128701897 isoform X2 [Cherax quadricarinatus]XP_053651862.1 uncharacterized protein LOC128701897 isoform X2 [Cherax quadricarinatus]